MPGDDELWREWLARHGPALVLYARQWAAGLQDAEDAVQDGFVRFWRARSRARENVAYLYACVRSAAMDFSRSDRSRRRREAREPGAQASCFDPAHAELAAQVETALARLAPEQREVVVMKIWGGLTFAQIAAALRISPNTAASRYRYALEHLEANLSRSCEIE
ncbi:MAG TPA: sigma-70 family RNA polymerase sigma factor [Tepidisphaeraceae bacterium]|nr:sigma-70 family RNA polymerase sigma factor [Tepidisphaeraceae bacterium]